jgi:protein ImuB
MHWLALLCPAEDLAAWGWWGLQFTPRVAQQDEALVLELSACERLFGGRSALLRRILQESPLAGPVPWARGHTAGVALALLRLKVQGMNRPARVEDLPLETLSAAVEHAPMLARAGCRTWGQLRALPRGGVARRFGARLLEELDAALGDQPETHAWLSLPEVFDVRLELVALATAAPELMWTAQRLLTQLQLWLRARQRGVLALELTWTLDLKRLDGKPLPPEESLVVRTARPVQETAHLRRLVHEHLARASLSAPASQLRLRSLETAPWAGASTSLLPEDSREGERLHELVERLSVRLGADQVCMPLSQADWRPERMQQWRPACEVLPKMAAPAAVLGLAKEKEKEKEKGRAKARAPAKSLAAAAAVPPGPKRRARDGGAGEERSAGDPLYPAWLLPEPLALQVQGNRPHYGGPLSRLVRLYRVETGWWEAGRSVRRDYYIARSPQAGLVWIYQEHAVPAGEDAPSRPARWFLQGLYA